MLTNLGTIQSPVNYSSGQLCNIACVNVQFRVEPFWLFGRPARRYCFRFILFSSSPSGQLSGSGLAIKGRGGGDSETSSGHHLVGIFTLIPDSAETLHLDLLG